MCSHLNTHTHKIRQDMMMVMNTQKKTKLDAVLFVVSLLLLLLLLCVCVNDDKRFNNNNNKNKPIRTMGRTYKHTQQPMVYNALLNTHTHTDHHIEREKREIMWECVCMIVLYIEFIKEKGRRYFPLFFLFLFFAYNHCIFIHCVCVCVCIVLPKKNPQFFLLHSAFLIITQNTKHTQTFF